MRAEIESPNIETILSRVRSLSGLYLNGFNERALAVHPQILEQDGQFRGASAAARDAFNAMDSAELQALHKQFVQKSGGREPSLKDPKNKDSNNKQIQNSNDQKVEIDCFLDSQLIVEQMNGKYKIKNEGLKPLYWEIRGLIMDLGGKVTFAHISRSENTEADKLVNVAIDKADKASNIK